MENNKIIIIVLIVVIAALLVGIVAMMPNMNKQDTNLTFKSKTTLNEGDSLKIKLTDTNGTAIANQTVNITITDKDGSCDYHSVVTNENGTGKLKMDKNAGEYNVTVPVYAALRYDVLESVSRFKVIVLFARSGSVLKYV